MEQALDRRTFLSLVGLGSLSLFFTPYAVWAAEKPPIAGALLLARIKTPPFRDSVVLLFEHGKQGSGGLIVNKPDHRSLGRMMARMNVGGPVGRDRVLSIIHAPPGKWVPSWDLGVLAITRAPELLENLAAGAAEVKHVVACLGISGWAPGQLHGEIAAGNWQVVYPQPEALLNLLFETPACDRLDRARELPEGLPVSVPRHTI
jgi:putative transcriptional regulator